MIITRVIVSLVIVGLMLGLDHLIIEKTKVTPFDVYLYKDLLLGGMGIAGVILGLYCANIASVFSAKYSNVPKQISHDFQTDIITNSAIKKIIEYIAICTIMLMISIAKMPVTWGSLCFIAFLTIRMIVTFSVSGTRTYILSDTFRIADIHSNNITNSIRKLSKTNSITSDISFQSHLQKLCAKDISVLSEIANFNVDIPESQNPSMGEFMETNLVLLGRYWQIKNTIPHDSKWFSEKVVYPQWHTASHSQTSLATSCGRSIDSTQKPDHWWFEDALLTVNQICLDKLIKDSDRITIIKYLQQLALLSPEAVKSNSFNHWIEHLESVLNRALNYAANSQDKAFHTEDETASIFDTLASSFVQVLKFEKHCLFSLDIDKILNHACQISNNHKADINYRYFFNNSACDSLYCKLTAEKRIEEKRITPDWFIKQTVAQKIYEYLGELSTSVERIINIYLKTGQFLHEKDQTYIAAVYLAHSFEIISNCEEILLLINDKLPALEALHLEKSYVWEQVSTQKTQKELSELSKIAPNLLTKNCSGFAIHNWENRESKPDLLGLCYNHLCEHLIRSIETNDYEKFEGIYSDFFSFVLLYQEYVRSNVVKTKEQYLQGTVFYAATDPYIEYSMISGLAVLWGEFIRDSRWVNLIKTVLSEFNEASTDGKQNTLEYIVQVLNARKSVFAGVTNRSIIQTSWEQRIAHAMKESELFEFEYREFGHKVLKTDSKILYAFAGNLLYDSLHFNNSEEVFLIVFVNQYLEKDKRYKSQSGWEGDFDNEGN